MISAPILKSLNTKIVNANQVRSREFLTDLLNSQIDKNQILEADNLRLQQQQRKLLQLLQIRTQQVRKLRISNSLNQNNIKKQKFIKSNLNQSQRQISIPNSQNIKIKQAVQNLHEQKDPNNSTALYANDITQVQKQHKSEQMIRTYKQNAAQKQQQMVKMRQYYSKAIQKMQKQIQKQQQKCQKQCSAEIEQYRVVITKQKAKIEELFKIIQKQQEEKTNLQGIISQMGQKLQQKQHTQKNQQVGERALTEQVAQLKKKINTINQEYSNQMVAIQKANQQQKQDLLNKFQLQLKQMQQKSLLKIQQLNKRNDSKLQIYSKQLQQKQHQIKQINKQCITAQLKLRQTMVKYEQQCEIVLAIQSSKQKLQQKVNQLQSDLQMKDTQLISNSKNLVNIDNIHKQYNIKIQQKEKQLNQAQQKIQDLKKQIQKLSTNLGKQEKKHQDSTKKQNQQIYKLQSTVAKLKQQYQCKQQQLRYLQKENKLKQQDNKRLISKINKQSQRKQQYITKLQEKVQKIQMELAENENTMQQKFNDMSKYKEEMTNYCTKLKQQIVKKQKQLNGINKQFDATRKKFSQVQEKYRIVVNNQQFNTQQLNKKYSAQTERLKIVEQQKQNYKSLYDDSLKEVKLYQIKVIKIVKQNQQLKSKIEQLEIQSEYLKEQILANNLNQSEKQQLTKLKNQIIQQKAKINKMNQTNNKFKQENHRTIKQNMELQNQINQLKAQMTKLSNQNLNRKQIIKNNQQKIKQLQISLSQRCKELQTSMPYLNSVLEQKKFNQLEIEKKNNQIKKLISLVEMAKKSKAQEIVNLKADLQSYSTKMKTLQQEIHDNREVIQKFNRQKVNMLRQNTMRQDLLKKHQRENKQLKEELKQSQKNVQQLMHYIGIADTAMQTVQMEQSLSKKTNKR